MKSEGSARTVFKLSHGDASKQADPINKSLSVKTPEKFNKAQSSIFAQLPDSSESNDSPSSISFKAASAMSGGTNGGVSLEVTTAVPDVNLELTQPKSPFNAESATEALKQTLCDLGILEADTVANPWPRTARPSRSAGLRPDQDTSPLLAAHGHTQQPRTGSSCRYGQDESFVRPCSRNVGQSPQPNFPGPSTSHTRVSNRRHFVSIPPTARPMVPELPARRAFPRQWPPQRYGRHSAAMQAYYGAPRQRDPNRRYLPSAPLAPSLHTMRQSTMGRRPQMEINQPPQNMQGPVSGYAVPMTLNPQPKNYQTAPPIYNYSFVPPPNVQTWQRTGGGQVVALVPQPTPDYLPGLRSPELAREMPPNLPDHALFCTLWCHMKVCDWLDYTYGEATNSWDSNQPRGMSGWW